MTQRAVEVTTALCKDVLGRTGGWVEHNLLLLKQAAVTSSWQVVRQRLPTWPDRVVFHTGVPAPIPSVSTRHTPGTSLLPIRPGACTSCLHAGPLPMGRHAPCRLGDHEPPWCQAMPDGDGVLCHPAGTQAASDSAMEDHRWHHLTHETSRPGAPVGDLPRIFTADTLSYRASLYGRRSLRSPKRSGPEWPALSPGPADRMTGASAGGSRRSHPR
jgi:hypothetical protein